MSDDDTPARKLPQSPETETALLGSLLFDPTVIGDVSDAVSPDDFYVPANQVVAQVIWDLWSNDEPIDPAMIYNELCKRKQDSVAGGHEGLMHLVDAMPEASHAVNYARIIKNKALLRQLIAISSANIKSALDPRADVEDVLDAAESEILRLGHSAQSDAVPLPVLLTTAIRQIDEMPRGKPIISGLSTGFPDIDELICGLQKSNLIILAARPSLGKCLGKRTPVLLHDGRIKTADKICEGDLLMGPDSKPRRVLSCATGEETMYEIAPSRGMRWTCNSSHILSLICNSDTNKRFRKNRKYNISIKDYLALPGRVKHHLKLYRVGVDFPHRELPVEPYFLGLWLGDGHTDAVGITTADSEILEYLKAYSVSLGLGLTVSECKNNKANTYSITGRKGRDRHFSLQTKLREIGVLGNKHIPFIYYSNDRKARLELLAGLIDSDGYVNLHSGYGLVTKSVHLARDIAFLVRSLGLMATVKPSYNKVYDKTYFKLNIYGKSISHIPVRLPRKRFYMIKKKDFATRTNFKVLQCPNEHKYCGFELSGDGLFLLGDFTVTHNTTLALNIAEHVALEENVPVAIFSLETSADQIATNILCTHAHVDIQKLRSGHLADKDFTKLALATGVLQNTPATLYIDDSGSLTPFQLKTKARRLKTKHGIGLIIVDYLQLMHANKKSRELEISFISRHLKLLAKELDIPILAVSQLSRKAEDRKRPQLSDLRESGAIEQDADVVFLLYRQDYGKPDAPSASVTELIVAKQRHGPTGKARLLFLKNYLQFANLAIEDEDGEAEQKLWDQDEDGNPPF